MTMHTPHVVTVGAVGIAGAAVVAVDLIVAQTFSIDPATLVGIGTLIGLLVTAIGTLAGAYVLVRNANTANALALAKADEDRKIAADDRRIAAEERLVVQRHMDNIKGTTDVIKTSIDGAASSLREIAAGQVAKIEALEREKSMLIAQQGKSERREDLAAQAAAFHAVPAVATSPAPVEPDAQASTEQQKKP